MPHSNVLDRLAPGARVLVLRLRSLGDCVLTTPALELLKTARRDLHLAVAVEDRYRELFAGNPDVEALLQPEWAAVRSWRPELCLNLHGGTRSALLAAASGAKWRAGFAHFRYSWIYNLRIPRAQQILGIDRVVHTAEHLASAMFFLGVPRAEIPRAKLFATAPRSPASNGATVIHPFASQPDKTWPPERFADLARRLDRPVTFLGGPGDNLSAFAGFPTLAGRPLAEVKAALSGASLFIGNDSGPAHMAAAFGLPLVVLFGASDVDVWRPWKSPAEVLTAPSGIRSISVEDVLSAVTRLRVHA